MLKAVAAFTRKNHTHALVAEWLTSNKWPRDGAFNSQFKLGHYQV